MQITFQRTVKLNFPVWGTPLFPIWNGNHTCLKGKKSQTAIYFYQNYFHKSKGEWEVHYLFSKRFFLDLQKFLHSVVHVLHTLHLRQSQAPAVTDVKNSSIFSCRHGVFAVDAACLRKNVAIRKAQTLWFTYFQKNLFHSAACVSVAHELHWLQGWQTGLALDRVQRERNE